MADSKRIDKITGAMKKKDALYSDFYVNFNKHPDTGNLTKYTDAASVSRAIRNLIFTNKGERLFDPSIGCDVRKILFENFSEQTTDALKTYIEETINNHESRVNLLEVVVTPKEDRNLYVVSIVFEIYNSETPLSITLQLNRVR